MHRALQLAKFAYEEGEVPVGAVLLHKNKVIGEGWNQSIKHHDPTAHAEIIALRQGGLMMKNYRLLECTLYVTLEPCIMCIGALAQGRINSIIYGAKSKKIASIEDLINNFKFLKINHHFQIISGVLAPACSEILKNFFRTRRLINKKNISFNKKV